MIKVDLQGIWELYLDGEKKCQTPPVANDSIRLPDSTAHAGKGTENIEPNTGYMTDRFYFEGYAWYSRKIQVEEEWLDKEITLFLERTRISTVYIDGVEIGTENSLCGFHRHDLTGKLKAGEQILTVRVNNTDYPTRGGHMTSPDTQTNWNGIVGRIELQIRNAVHPEEIWVDAKTPSEIKVTSHIAGIHEGTALLTLSRKDGEALYRGEHVFQDGRLQTVISLEGENLLWDEYNTNLLCAKVTVEGESEEAVFGIRKLSHEGRKLLINDREVFWRGKHDGLVFPSTGFAPMTVEEWKKVFATVKEYGINHYRFHTCCPPDAAFAAADEMGIYMEPELPFWGTIAAPGEEYYNEEEQKYLVEEGFRILQDFGNHPSFVMLSMGNELWGSMERINSFLRDYKQFDNRHMYTQGSNNFQFCPAVLSEEDVFCGVRLSSDRLFRGSYAMCDAPQGHIQTMEPNSVHNYDEIIAPQIAESTKQGDGEIEIQYGTGTKKVKAVEAGGALIPQVPVISHEVGQYDFFPDFTELGRYEGSQQPLYLEIYRQRMEASDTFKQWKDFYKSTGVFALDCYRREIEAALRTGELSGFQLLDLQDFPGQNVALVGVLNAWLESKNLITPEKWRQFCSDTVVLAELDRFVVSEGEEVSMPVKLSVCNRNGFAGRELIYSVTLEQEILAQGSYPVGRDVLTQKEGCGKGERLQEVGTVRFTIPKTEHPKKVEISLKVVAAAEEAEECNPMGSEKQAVCANDYTLWAYPETTIEITEKHIVYGDREVLIAGDEREAEEWKAAGKCFVYVPKQQETDVEGTYCTDFWNYPMFRSISESMNRKVPVGTLGLYIHDNGEWKTYFPCEDYSTPQWFHLVMHSHCSVLTGKEDVELIVQPIDNVERCHKLGMLYYEKDMLVCTSRLWEIKDYPEVKSFARALVEMCWKER